MNVLQALLDGERAGAGRMLVPPRRAKMVAGGVREGRRAGGSLEFRDYRDYEPGDDLRHLDWGLFARSDRLAVKRFNEEVSPYVDLILDGSKSMAFEPCKGEVALSLAAMLATAARNAGFPYAVWMPRERLTRVAQGIEKPSLWTGLDFGFAGDPAPPLARGASTLRPFSIRIFISDLLWPSEPNHLLHSLAANASAVIVVELVSAADENPEPFGDIRLVDVESGEEQDVIVNGANAAAFRGALLRHRQSWDEAVRECHATIVRAVAEEVGEDLLAAELAKAGILQC